MGRDYKVIDADGHILEPVDLWDTYMDPQYRARAPRMFTDTDGKDRLNMMGRSYWIPGSWHLRMVYTNAIPFHDPSQESNRAG